MEGRTHTGACGGPPLSLTFFPKTTDAAAFSPSSYFQIAVAVAASSRPASIASSSSASQYHLPELKSSVEIYNNSNSSKEDVGSGSQPSEHPTVNPAVLPCSGGPNSASSSSSSSQLNSDEFVQRLIEAVHKQPCLYNPNHEHYGNKHASAQYRASIWQNLCQELEYTDEPHSCKPNGNVFVIDISALKNHNPANQSAAARHFDSMRWIDEFLNDSSSNSSPSIIGNSNGDAYYPQPHSHNNQRRRTTILAVKGGAKTGGSLHITHMTKAVLDENTTQLQNNGQTHLMYRGKEDVGPSLHGLAATTHPALSSVSSGSASYQLVSVPQQQQHLELNSSKNLDQSIMTMIIGDGHGANTAFYQHQPNSSGTQKMYRLVPANEMNAQQQQPAHQPVVQQHQHHLGTVQQQHEVQSPSQAPRRKKAGTGGSRTTQHLITQSNEGILEANTLIGGNPQLVIERDRILINNNQQQTSSVNQQQHMVVSQQHQQQQIHPSSSSHLSQHGSIQRVVGAQRAIHNNNNGRNSSVSDLHHPNHHTQHLQQQSQQQQQHYILSAPQQHYDPESALIETIVRHLGNLNDDEKVVTKMNIQRILMDARFGRGACVRMFREEEQSENMAAMENQRHLQQQQQQQNSSRR
uniref:MADF domain-containing protein n=1 Tax=Ditylenchus dipsaci TaxID=166011 RepID=A0A915D2K8_9BILA